MSDEGDKTCPICTEEMDLTDQQLKPCKCGYEICVWCWHHIMDMAEKEDTEGRCPACRKPYDKEKIVGMAASCERLVAEISSERKLKAQKAKPKASEGRKHLSSVRVIQRNLVYIIGLPLNLADEDLLQRKEYFGQYGKVLKVSISRTAGGAIQHSANNTCSVYITYSKEEEAVRCIQSVHGFVLEGRSLRACFGTTKYCHAWIRNVPCNNPDCLYLHDMGTQEDSFTKDEIISAYTRSRVQQITGATTNLQRRSGNTLPPPIDDYCNNSTSSTGKPIIKNASNQNAASQVRCSPPSCSSGRSISLPLAASWGTRISNCSQPAVNPVCSIGPTKQKPDILNNSGVHPTTDASISQSSTSPVDIGKKYMVPEESPTSQADVRLGRLESTNQYVTRDCLTTLSNVSAEPVVDAISAGVTSSSHTCVPASIGKDGGILHTNTAKYVEFAGLSSDNGPEKGGNIINDGNVQSLCYGMSSINIEGHHRNEQMEAALTNSLVPNSSKSPGNQGLQQYSGEQFREPLYTTASRKSPLLSSNGVCSVREQSEWRPDSHLCVLREACGEVEGNALGLNNQGLNDTDVFSNLSYFPRSSHLPSISNHSSLHSWQQNEVNSASKINADAVTVHKTVEEASFLYTSRNSISSNGYNESKIRCSAGSDGSFEHSILLPNAEKGKHIGRFSDNVSNDGKNPALDMGESRIISNILSMDIDAWDEKHGCFKLSSSWKGQNSNQSRFSFARQEDFSNQVNNMDPFDMRKECSSPQDSLEQRGSFVDKFRNGFSSTSFDESDTSSGHYIMPSNKLPVSRVQISAPPGFSGPSRVPPPGFSFHDRVDQAFDSSVNCLLEVPFLLENQYQASSAGNFSSNGDVEFIDPAILAVGKGRLPNGLNNSGLDMRPALPAHLSAAENEARLRLAMQQAISGNQNLRFSGHTGDRFSPWNEGYGIPSRLMEQAQASYLSPISQLSLQQQSRAANLSNGSWDVWTEAQTGSDLGIGDLMRNERLGVNKNFQGYEDLKFRRHPGNLYNRAFGM